MPDYTFIVMGAPVAKGRARSSRLPNGDIMHRTPLKTQVQENNIKVAIMTSWGIKTPLTVPLEVDVINYVPIPPSWSGKKKKLALSGHVRPTARPDVDNYLKLAMDALNGIVWRDDALIVDGRSRKLFSDKPRLEINISRIKLEAV